MFTVALLLLFTVLCIILSGDGAWDNLTKPARNQLVFEGRPKDYGAFVLRREYDRRFILAFSGALTIMSLAVIVPKVMGLITGAPIVSVDPQIKGIDVLIDDVFDVPDAPSKPADPPPPTPPSTPVGAGIPIVVDDTVHTTVREDTLMATSEPDTAARTRSASIGEPGTGKPTSGGNGKPGVVTGSEDTTYVGPGLPFPPSFPGGDQAMYEFIKDGTRYPDDAFSIGVSERIFVEFVVEKDGSISNVHVVKGKYPSLRTEAMRVVRSMPRWSPGRMDKNAVRCRLVLPINFTVAQ